MKTKPKNRKKWDGLKTHHFVVGVRTSGTRRGAKLAVLSSFARRQPDGCEFYLRDLRKEEWMTGARAGLETGLELAARSIAQLCKRTILRPAKKQ